MSVMTTFPLYKYVLGIYSEVLGHYPPGMEVAHGLGNLVGQIQVTIMEGWLAPHMSLLIQRFHFTETVDA